MADTNLGTAKGKIVIDASGATKGVNEASSAIDSLDAKAHKSASGGLVALSGALLTAGAAGVGAFALAVNAAADFEQTLSGIKAVSGATEKQMDSLKKKAMELGRDTAFSASEAAMAMEELSKAGLGVEDILNGAADATVNLAAAGGVSLPEAATIAANAMNQFNLAAEDMPHVADLIAGAANASAIDVSDFGMSMAQAGATANLVGLSFDDLALAITAMGNAGIKGSDAGTSLKTFMANLQPTTEKQIELFYSLGLAMEENVTSSNTMGNAFFDNEGKIKSMAEIAGVLETALAGQSDAQKAATLEAIFGSDAIRAAAIIAETGAEGFDTLAASMGGISAADVAATRMDNLKGSIEVFKGSLETAAIQIGDRFLPKVRELVDMATEVINKFGELDTKTQDIIIAVAGGATAFALLAGSVGLFVTAIGPVAAGLASAFLLLGRMKIVIALISALSGPVAIVIAALAVLAAGLYFAYQRFEVVREIVGKVRDFFIDLGNRMAAIWKSTIRPALEDFANFFMEDILPAVVGFVETIIPRLQEFASFFMDTILPAVLAFAGAFLETVIPVVQSFVDYFLNVVVPTFMTVLGVVGEFVMGIVSWFTDTLVPWVTAAWTTVWTALQSAVGPVLDWFNTHVVSTLRAAVELIIGVFQRIGDFVTIILIPILQTAFSLIGPIIETAFGVAVIVIGTAVDVISTIIETFVEFVTTFWQLFGDNIISIMEIAWNIIMTVVETILGVIRGIIETVTGLITADWDKFTQGLNTLWDTVWGLIEDIVQTAVDLIEVIVQTAIDAIHLAIDTGLNLIKGIWDVAWSVIRAAVALAWLLIRSLVDKGIEFIKDVIDTGINIALSVWDGAWNLFKDAVSGAWDAIRDTVSGIVGWIQGKVDAVMSGIRAAKSALDALLGGRPDVLGDDFVILPELPEGADGGIFGRATAMIIGEAGAEALIPMTDTARALQLLNRSGLTNLVLDTYGYGSGTETSTTPNVTVQMSAPAGSGSQGPAMVIQEANFYDGVDVDTLSAQMEFARMGGSF